MDSDQIKSKRSPHDCTRNKRFQLLSCKHSQVTIFIIMALIIVVSIILIFIFLRKPTVSISPSTDPQAYIEKCIKDATKEAIDILSEHGGDINPEGCTMYKGKNITYLCYNANLYLPCINQRPLLIEHIEKEIKDYTEPEINSCFASLKDELQKRNYAVSMESMNLSVELETRRVVSTVNRKFSMTKNEEVQKFDKFKAQVSHPIYDLAKIAMEISNQEAEYCNFDVLGYMATYPQYDLGKFRPGDSDIIYVVKDVPTDQKFKFAIRSCALPPGF